MSALRSGCKVNLGLRIAGKLPNGRHSLATVFYPLEEPADTLEVASGATGVFQLHCQTQIAGVNILETTLRLFNAAAGVNFGAEVRLDKRVPQGAGLGGASANAAVFLKWLNSRLDSPLSPGALAAVASKIGADVPFFLLNKAAAAYGAGEILTPICASPEFWLLVIWPGIILSTAQVFMTYDKLAASAPPLTNSRHADKKFFHHACRLPLPGENDLERAALALCPQLSLVKSDLRGCNPEFYGMSGSGSSFYGVFFNRRVAEMAKKRLGEKYSHIYLSHFGEIANQAQF